MNRFEGLMDINEACDRYSMTPQGIKYRIGKDIIEGRDVKKFGNSWVFDKVRMDVIFRDKLVEDKPLTEDEKQGIYDLGRRVGLDYIKKLGQEVFHKKELELLNAKDNRNEFIHIFLNIIIECDSSTNNYFLYVINHEYSSSARICLLTGFNNAGAEWD